MTKALKDFRGSLTQMNSPEKNIRYISISEILKRGCWSKENTFTKFYDEDIIKSNCSDFDYSYAALSQM